MKTRQKPRPNAIYREEGLNEYGEWTCRRMSHDERQFRIWMENSREYLEGREPWPTWMGERRYLRAELSWEEV